MTFPWKKKSTDDTDSKEMAASGKGAGTFLKKWGIGIFLPILIIIFLYLLQTILVHFPSIGEGYCRTVFVWVSFLPVTVTSLFPVSLSEIVVISGVFCAPLLLALWVIHLVRAVKNKGGKRFFFRSGRIVAWVLCGLYFIFMLFHGLNYTRYSLDEKLGFGQKKYTIEEIQEAYIWVVTELNCARENCPEDENGVLTYPGGYEASLSDIKDLYEESAVHFPQIKGNTARPKPVAVSHYWSYTNIVGMYFPFLAESNINVDVPFPALPSTVCHELSHLHGYAVENDADLAGMLIGLYSSCPQVRYGGLCDALDLVWSDLLTAYNKDTKGFEEFVGQYPICDGYFRDQEAMSKYWEGINPPKIVEKASEKANDTFLKINQQEEGVNSYAMPTSTVADFYFLYVRSGQYDSALTEKEG